MSCDIYLHFLLMFQVLSKEREIQKTREIKEDFSSRIHGISEKLKAISAKFKEKSPDVDHAKEEVKVGYLILLGLSVNLDFVFIVIILLSFRSFKYCQNIKSYMSHFFSQSLAEDLDSCGRTLSELDAAVQEFGRRNPLLAKQLSDAISKLSEMHHHTTRLADCRNNWLKKVCAHAKVSFLYNIHKSCYSHTLFFCVVPQYDMESLLSWLFRLSVI